MSPLQGAAGRSRGRLGARGRPMGASPRCGGLRAARERQRERRPRGPAGGDGCAVLGSARHAARIANEGRGSPPALAVGPSAFPVLRHLSDVWSRVAHEVRDGCRRDPVAELTWGPLNRSGGAERLTCFYMVVSPGEPARASPQWGSMTPSENGCGGGTGSRGFRGLRPWVWGGWLNRFHRTVFGRAVFPPHTLQAFPAGQCASCLSKIPRISG